MARAWPGLRRLELGFDHWERNDHEPQASLASLAELAQACPYGGPFVHLLSHALIGRTATLIGLPHFARTVAL